MKRTYLLALLTLLLSPLLAGAKDGYKIMLKLTDRKDSMVYLAHYYGKPLPTIYKRDSARFDKYGVATFQSNEKLVGGIYMMLLSDKSTYFEFLLDNGDDFSIAADTKNLPEGLSFKGSQQNDQFAAYIKYLKGYGSRQQTLQADYAKAKTKDDSAALRKQSTALGKELIAYRQQYVSEHNGTLLASIFGALQVPQVPEGEHRLPDGKIDSNFSYNYYKSHYWDGFNFHDDRLIHAPLYDAKLDEYMNKLVLPVIDSVEKESDLLLAKTRGQQELFKYTLWWLTRNVETSKIMGMDQVFVYLVENYYMKGDAYWLDQDALNKYYDRAQKIAPNIIGNLAPEINMEDMNGKAAPLSSVKAKYTLVVFWEPTCGHCQKELPQLDSAYRASLKARGVRIYAVRTEGEMGVWKDFVTKHHLEEWTHVYDPEHHSDYRSKYDVYSTPTIYLLDEKKIIRGKRLDHSNIGDVIDMIERKEKAAKAQNK